MDPKHARVAAAVYYTTEALRGSARRRRTTACGTLARHVRATTDQGASSRPPGADRFDALPWPAGSLDLVPNATRSGSIFHVVHEVLEIERLPAQARCVVSDRHRKLWIRADDEHRHVDVGDVCAQRHDEPLSGHFWQDQARDDQVVLRREYFQRMFGAAYDVDAVAVLGEIELEESSERALRLDDQDKQLPVLHDLGGRFGSSEWWIDSKSTPPVSFQSCGAFSRPAEQ